MLAISELHEITYSQAFCDSVQMPKSQILEHFFQHVRTNAILDYVRWATDAVFRFLHTEVGQQELKKGIGEPLERPTAAVKHPRRHKQNHEPARRALLAASSAS